MSKVHLLRALVKQRLTAAAEEIFGLFERTIAEYEEEIYRQRRLLQDAELQRDGAVFSANVKKFTVIKEVPAEQQEWSSSLDQDDPEPPPIKEEQEKLWIRQEGEQLQGPEEVDVKFPFSPLSVDREETQTEENRGTEHLETEADGKYCGGPDPAKNSDPDTHLQAETGNYDVGLKQKRELQTGFQALRNNEVSVSDTGYKAAKKSFIYPEGNETFSSKDHMLTHMNCHICQFCGKKFTKSSNLTTHLRVHTGEKPFPCSVCNTSFSLRCTLVNHMRVHTGEKPFVCSVCSKRFSKKANLTTHMVLHTEEKPFKCSICDKRFTWHSQVKNHKCVVVDSSR